MQCQRSTQLHQTGIDILDSKTSTPVFTTDRLPALKAPLRGGRNQKPVSPEHLHYLAIYWNPKIAARAFAPAATKNLLLLGRRASFKTNNR